MFPGHANLPRRHLSVCMSANLMVTAEQNWVCIFLGPLYEDTHMNHCWTALALLIVSFSPTDATTVRNGPMLGYSTMAESLIWVQTDGPATVQARYWPLGSDPAQAQLTDGIITAKETAWVAKLLCDRVQAGTRYAYEILLDGIPAVFRFRAGYGESGPLPLTFQTPPNWRFRESGHQIFDFRVAAGSCAYINEEGGYDRLNSPPYGAEFEIFERIYEQRPDLMIWLGDNVYYRETDFWSWTGMVHRWTADRSLPELQPLLATTHHYALWDDHDYGPNNAGWDFPLKALSQKAFSLFHGNPSAGLPELPGNFTFFNWGDVNFYLLDNRTYRDTDGTDPKLFGRWKRHWGKEQVDWLVNALKWSQTQAKSSYPVNFQVICTGSQVLSDNPYPENYRTYSEEWTYLFDRIRHEGIDGVFFLSGDVHYTELSMDRQQSMGQINPPGKAGPRYAISTFYDLTVSPLTSGVHRGETFNKKRVVDFAPTVDGTIRERNFAVLRFHGPLEDRQLTIEIYGSSGQLLNQKAGAAPGTVTDVSLISAQSLKAPRYGEDHSVIQGAPTSRLKANQPKEKE